MSNEDSMYLTTNQAYVPDSNRWISRTSMPTPRWGHAVASYGGRIYVIGGDDGADQLDIVEIYNPDADLQLKHIYQHKIPG